MTRLAALGGILVVAMASTQATAQIFSSDLNGDATGWTIVENGDTSSTFQFDYSTQGIPSAPNGDGTVGVRLASNLTSDAPGAGSAISISPGIAAAGRYTVQYDFWMNYHINGSTEEAGGAVGFDPGAGDPLGGVGFRANSDGDSGTDYKLYSGGAVLGLGDGYAIPSLNHTDASNTALQEAFPAQTAPDAQGTGYTNTLGGLAFKWHTMLVDVDSDAGTANFSVDGFDFGTITAASADLTGDISLIHTDPFGSVAGNADLAFVVFDNVSVNQIPEPSANLLLLAGMGGMAFFRRRR